MSSNNGFADLTLADFRKVRERRIEKVHVPDLGGYAYLQSLYGDELEQWEDSRLEKRGGSMKLNAENTRASLLVLTLVSADGRPIGFTEDDVKGLGKQDARALNQLFSLACEMNGLTKDDLEALNRPKASVMTHAVSSGSE